MLVLQKPEMGRRRVIQREQLCATCAVLPPNHWEECRFAGRLLTNKLILSVPQQLGTVVNTQCPQACVVSDAQHEWVFEHLSVQF